MQPVSLAQFIALNDQLLGLVRAGIPVHLGVRRSPAEASGALERISATVARRVGEGASIVQALDDPEIPAAYRSVTQLALASGNLGTALSAASQKALALDDSWQVLRLALIYPLVICGLAYVGLVLFTLFLVPHLQHTYRDMGVQPGSGLAVANSLQSGLPYWIGVAPLALVLLVGLSRKAAPQAGPGGRNRGVVRWLPGVPQIVHEQRLAGFAEMLASLLDAGVPLPDALSLSAAHLEDASLIRTTRELAQTFQSGREPAEDSAVAGSFPPFLRWAIFQADGAIGRARALRMAANVYRQSAQRRLGRMRLVVPLVACVVLGGGITLLYALALFVPVAQMIQGLAA